MPMHGASRRRRWGLAGYIPFRDSERTAIAKSNRTKNVRVFPPEMRLMICSTQQRLTGSNPRKVKLLPGMLYFGLHTLEGH